MNEQQLKQEIESLHSRISAIEEMISSMQLKTPRTNFQPPTSEQVAEYFLERLPLSSSEDALNFADVFISHYTNTGWKYGKNKMKDWKAAMRSAWDLTKFVNKNKSNYESKLGRIQRADLQQWLDQ